MSVTDAILYAVGAGLLMLGHAAITYDVRQTSEKEGFQRGWLAGIDYEKQRRKDNQDAE